MRKNNGAQGRPLMPGSRTTAKRETIEKIKSLLGDGEDLAGTMTWDELEGGLVELTTTQLFALHARIVLATTRSGVHR